MLDNILRLTDVRYVSLSNDVPEWASPAVMNLSASRIITSGEARSDALTRAEAAQILLRALDK